MSTDDCPTGHDYRCTVPLSRPAPVFPAWLARLPKRDRRIAKALAASHTTSDVAERFGVSRARVSQLRRELHEAWDRFHGESMIESAAVRCVYGQAIGLAAEQQWLADLLLVPSSLEA